MTKYSPRGDSPAPARFFAALVGIAVLCGAFALKGCDNRSPSGKSLTPPSPSHRATPRNAPAATTIPLPSVDQRLCTGIVVLIDTSGSMRDSVPGKGPARAKHLIARDALQRIMRYTGEWKKTHTDRMLQLGLYNFSSSPSVVLPMGEFNLEAAEKAANRIPAPGGGTAIGEAIKTGFEALYRSGCTRKYLVCITDGQNTAGAPPERVARQLYRQTGGEVEIHFVAFDTSRRNFGFLEQVNGNVVEAANAEELQARLSEIYEKRILAETMPAEK